MVTRHGIEGSYRAGCRCQECLEASRRGQKLRSVGRAGLVPSDRVVDLLWRLQRQGWSLRDVEASCGVAVSTLSDLAFGRRARLRKSVETRILNARYERRKSFGIGDAVGTRRRLQALHAIGWSWRSLGSRVGMRPLSLSDLAAGRTVPRVSTEEKVRAVFEEISGTPGGDTRAASYARRRGWPPPLAWDDIDDPWEKPQGLAG